MDARSDTLDPAQAKFGIGQSVPRTEDPKLLRGQGRYTDDHSYPGMLHAAFVRSHFDAIEARVADAPRAGEILVAVSVTDSGRPLPRVGGLQVHEIKGQDGLR